MTFTEIDNQTTHHAATQVGKFECRKGQDCEARRVRNSYDDDFTKGERNDHQHDAFSIAEWMHRSDLDGTLAKFFTPNLEHAEKKAADAEGWILGVA